MKAASDRPTWFDDRTHVHRDNGIFERETGLFLAADGLPYAGGARLTRLVATGATSDPLGLVDDDMIAGQIQHRVEVARAEHEAATKLATASKVSPAADAGKRED